MTPDASCATNTIRTRAPSSSSGRDTRTSPAPTAPRTESFVDRCDLAGVLPTTFRLAVAIEQGFRFGGVLELLAEPYGKVAVFPGSRGHPVGPARTGTGSVASGYLNSRVG